MFFCYGAVQGRCGWLRSLGVLVVNTLLNLVGVMGEASKEQVWGYLGNYLSDANAAAHPELDRMIGYALAYHRDFIAPTLKRRAPEGVQVPRTLHESSRGVSMPQRCSSGSRPSGCSAPTCTGAPATNGR